MWRVHWAGGETGDREGREGARISDPGENESPWTAVV